MQIKEKKIIELRDIIDEFFPEKFDAPNHVFCIKEQSFEYYNGFYFRLFKYCEDGYSFGEVALTEADRMRTATIKCESDCTFAVMDRKPYQRCF